MVLSRIHILNRERVTRALADAAAVFPLTLVTAPMGYGKTEAARLLTAELAGRDGWRAFHLTVDKDTHSVGHAWNRLCRQLAHQGAEFGEALKRIGMPLDAGARRRFLDLYRKLLQADARQTLIVVDDWHLIPNAALDPLLEIIAYERLPHLSLLALSRVRPSIALDELYAKHLAIEFDQTLLAFTIDETAALCRLLGRCGREEEAEMWRRSGGWAAALWLEFRNRDTDAVPASIDTLLERAVFNVCSRAEKRLLLRLSILDSFTPEQAVFLSRDPEAPARLSKLRDRNAFIVREASGTYRMHSLLRVFLTRKLAEIEAVESLNRGCRTFGIDRRALCRRAGELYLNEGDVVRAMHLFGEAGEACDHDRILELSEQPGENIALILDPIGISGLFLSLPVAARRARPIGWLAFLFHYITGIDAKRGGALLEETAADFAAPGGIDPELADRVAGEMALVRSFLSFGDMPRMVAGHLDAIARLQSPSRLVHREQPWLITCPHAGFIYHHAPGGYAEMADLCEQAIGNFLLLSGGCGTGGELLMRGELLLESGRMEEARALLTQADDEARRLGQMSVRIGIAFAMARLILADRAAGNPLEPLARLEPELAALGHPMHAVALELAAGYVHATGGKAGRIAEWLRLGNFDPTLRPHQGLGMEYVVHGKALLCAGQWARLHDFCGHMLARFEEENCIFGLIHAHCLLAAEQANGNAPDGERRALEEAVELTRPDGIILTVAEYGAHILRPLQRFLAENSGDQHLRRLAAQAKRHAQAVPGPGARNRIRRLLTAREAELLRLAAKGKSNAAIAKQAGIAVVTVKKTLSSAYDKLGAKNRAEAVRKLSEQSGL